MAITRTYQFPLNALSPFNALFPDFTRTDDQHFRWNGHPCEVHVIENNTTTTDYNLQTTLNRVINGLIYNGTDSTNETSLPITPLSTNATIAVITGNLAASKNYLVVVVGHLD